MWYRKLPQLALRHPLRKRLWYVLRPPLCYITSFCRSKSFSYQSCILQRRCGNCGALGHMKTNRKCPMFKENAGGGNNTTSGSSTPVVTGSVFGEAGSIPSSRLGSEIPDGERFLQTPAPQTEDHGNHIKLEGTKLSIPKSLLERYVRRAIEIWTTRISIEFHVIWFPLFEQIWRHFVNCCIGLNKAIRKCPKVHLIPKQRVSTNDNWFLCEDRWI